MCRYGFLQRNSPDTMNSSDEELLKEEHGEVLTVMYTEGLKAPVLLSQAAVARQRAAWSYAKSQGYGATLSDSPQTSGFEGSEFSDSDLPRSQSVSSSPSHSMGGSKIKTSGPNNTPESEAPPAPRKRKERFRKEGGHPACRAPNGHSIPRGEQGWRLATYGRPRANGYVCGARPPFQDLSCDLFLRGGFSPQANPAGSMDQCDPATRHSQGVA
jgi:hypothetical protein